MPKVKDATAAEFHFEGFPEPNTHQTPNLLIDWILGHPEIVSDAEYRVLSYLSRRTCGFGKEADAVSLNQFIHGISKRTGERLDYGCGVKNRTHLVDVLGALERKGFIEADKGNDARGGKATTRYRLRFWKLAARDPDEVVPSRPRSQEGTLPNEHQGGSTPSALGGSTLPALGVVRPAHLQSKVKQSKEYEYISNNSNPVNGNEENSRLNRSTKFSIKLKNERTENEEQEQPTYQQVTLAGNSTPGPTRVGKLLEKTQQRLARGTRRNLDPQIRQLITQYSEEWRDPAVKSNITQARHLLEQSHLSANDFVGLLYEARSITKQDGRGAQKKMAYYFAVLRDLLGGSPGGDASDDAEVD